MSNDKKPSRSRALAAKLIYSALSILRDNGKEMPIRDLLSKVGQRVELDDWDKVRYEKSGSLRWESILHFTSICCIKAGYIVKKSGIWCITPDGEEALKLTPEKLLEAAAMRIEHGKQSNQTKLKLQTTKLNKRLKKRYHLSKSNKKL
jgi:restriction system protein